jgi:hypothetical protein
VAITPCGKHSRKAASPPNEKKVSRSLHLQIEIALAGFASKILVAAGAAAGRLQTSDPFIVYPAPGALEIGSAYGCEAAEALQRVVGSINSIPSSTFAVSTAESLR